jgi:hypothetical protein
MTLLMARFVWSVMHGVAMLERLRSGIEISDPKPSRPK